MDNKIGTRIRTLRVGKGLSQKEIADLLHVSPSAYSRMENGESNNWVHYIDAFCNIFKIKPEDLFTSEGFTQNNGDNASAVQNHTQHDTHITINHLSDKVIELYEEKIEILKQEIISLKQKMEDMKKE